MDSNIAEMVQGSASWIQWKKDKIGSSDAPIIMGVSPWSTPYKLWCDKTGLLENQTITSYAMQRGIDLEGNARKEFENLTGIKVNPDILVHHERLWQIASLDGISKDRMTIVEIKCPGKEDHASAIDGKVPDKYYPQIQHQLAVTELDMAYYLSYDGQNAILIEVERDQLYIDEMIDKEYEFWMRCQNLISPELTDKDYQIKDDEAWNGLAGEWRRVTNQIKELEETQDALRQALIALANKQSCVGGGVKVQHQIRRGVVNFSIIPELKGINLEKYRKEPVTAWRIMECTV